MKIEWLVANKTSAGSATRAERDILGLIFGVFWTIQTTFVVTEQLFDVGVPS